MGRGYDGGLSTVAGDSKEVRGDRDGWMDASGAATDR